MKRLIIIHILFCSLLNIVANDFVPYRNVETTDDGIIVTYRFRGGIHQQDPLYPNAKYWKIPGFGLNEESGKPSTLSRWDSFAVPDGANATVEVLESEYTDTAFVLAPARHALFESDTIGYTLENVPPISAYAGYYPTDIVEKSRILNYRGQDIQRVEVHPIQYDHTNGIVRNYSMIKYRVNFENANTRSVKRTNTKISVTDPMVDNMVLNPANIIKRQSNARTRSAAIEDNRDYLIISIPECEDAVNEFAEWKRKMGFRVHVAIKDGWVPARVRPTIQELYNQDSINLCYLLIVGDAHNVHPSATKKKVINNVTHSYITDLYYGYANNGLIDSFKISRGRIPVNNNNDAAIVLNKIIQYEQNPTTDPGFYNTGLHCSYFQDNDIPSDGYEDRRFILTSEEVLDYMEQYIGKDIHRVYTTGTSVNPRHWNNGEFSYGEELPSYLKKPTFPWDGDSIDVISHVNNGCFYVLQRGHGGVTFWDTYGGKPFFQKKSISSFNNGTKLPIVFSISCSTGKFNFTGDCLAETFLKKEDGGCVGIIAATEESLSGYNDAFSEMMFDAIWPDTVLRIDMNNFGNDPRNYVVEPVYELGRIMDMGMKYLSEIGGYEGRIYTRELFHCFGDPSMMIRTEVPQKFSPSIKRTNGVISVNANCDSTRISFYTPATNQVDSYFGRTIDYPTTADSVIVCIDKHNYIPFVVNCDKNVYIQNETINDERVYVGENILVGKNVTTLKEQGEVLIQNANVKFQGKDVILQPGTTITNSNVEINADN